MNTCNRRSFFKVAGAGALGAAALSAPTSTLAAAAPRTFLKQQPQMHIGLVTYNLAKDWDIETIIKNCEATKFEGVELRTTHAHKVEVNLSAAEREKIKQRFASSKVQIMSLGSAFDYHTPDPAKLEKDMEASRAYIKLAHDVGAPAIKVRPNALPKEVPKEKTLEQIGKSLRALGEFGLDHGVEIRLEVHGTETQAPPNIRKIMDFADHKNVGVCWNSNPTDLDGAGFDANFIMLKDKIRQVHMRDIYLEDYPWRRLLMALNEIKFTGFCLAEIPESTDPLRIMRYYRALWLAYTALPLAACFLLWRSIPVLRQAHNPPRSHPPAVILSAGMRFPRALLDLHPHPPPAVPKPPFRYARPRQTSLPRR